VQGALVNHYVQVCGALAVKVSACGEIHIIIGKPTGLQECDRFSKLNNKDEKNRPDEG
jgi:hypothetical protein